MRTHYGIGVGIALLGAVIAACASSNSAAPAGGVKCTAGNYVFCRCEDRSEGTKLCKPDGVSFDMCVCDGSQPPITQPDPGDAGLGSTPMMTVDSGGPVAGPTIDAKCIGKLALVSGSSADNATFFASYKGAGVFTVTTSAQSPAVRGPITILPVGSTLIATHLARFGYIGWTKFAGSTWSSAESLTDGLVANTPTSMTLIGGQLRLFYLGQDGHYHMGTYGTSGWDVTFDPGALAEPAAVDGGVDIPGKSAPTSAAVGSSVTLAFSGNDGSLARETFASGSWSTITKFPAVTAYASAPAVVALDPGGTKDELMVYGGTDLKLHVSTREASNKVWNTPILFDTAASSSELALGSLPGGKAIFVYKASNGQGYYSVWAEGAGFSTPAELVPGKNPEIATVPSIVRGTCGSDADIAYAQKDGTVKIVRFTAGTMTAPFDVGGLTKTTFVGIGELP